MTSDIANLSQTWTELVLYLHNELQYITVYNESPEKRARLNPNSSGENAFSCLGLAGGDKEPLLAKLLPSLPKLGVGDSR